MAGFFGFFDYNKPGPGIPEDAPPKAPIFVFLDIVGRKFWNLMKLNMLFFIFNIPAILFTVYFANQILIPGSIFGGKGDFQSELITKTALAAIFLCIPLLTVGPAQAGFTYVLRNYAREEHAWIWSDFKEHAFKNFKQSLIICIIDLLVALIVAFDINAYMHMKQSNLLLTISSSMLVIAFIIYIIMHLYIYPMMVTFSLTIKQIYKNALIFAIMKFFPNLGILLINFVLVNLCLMFYPVIGLLLFFFIIFSFTGLMNNFYVYPKLKKYIIDKNDEANGTPPKAEQENTLPESIGNRNDGI